MCSRLVPWVAAQYQVSPCLLVVFLVLQLFPVWSIPIFIVTGATAVYYIRNLRHIVSKGEVLQFVFALQANFSFSH